MANRDGQASRAVRLAIGGAVLAARGRGVPWKALEAAYGRGRMQLWRYARAAEKCAQAANDTSSLWTRREDVHFLRVA